MGRIIAFIVTVYALGFVLTFGHAYHQESMRITHIGDKTYKTDPAARSMGSMLAAMFWPLYWSIDLMEPERSSEGGGNEHSR